MQVLGNVFGVTYYNVTNNQVILAIYHVPSFGAPPDPTKDTPSTIMSGGISFRDVVDPQKHAFVLYACGVNRTEVCALSSTGDNNNAHVI